MKLLTWKLQLPQEAAVDQEEDKAAATAYLLDWGQEEKKKVRPAVVICPGGGYGHIAHREGEPIAMEFLAMGYHAFVLRYSLAPCRFPAALLELGLLMAQIREHSQEWSVDPDKIVVSGFSAGGHLACSLGTFWNREFVYGPLGKNAEDIKPNGMILGYPVISSGPHCHGASFERLLGEECQNEEKRSLVSLENQVGPHTPKTFLWHTVTDETVPVKNAFLLAESLIKNQVSVEFHLYPTGGHGLSLATWDTCGGRKELVEPRCQSWISLAEEWMKNL